ncbi:MAG: hypothetical protein CFK49_03950 [Armatimonadetes bacterium JP3_11]|nr:MAG: hypothetical protein CFK49_03950 [Armatimonadetes bacterium JP3_11]RMH09664.1 MAG: hypothetical protein D6697_02970 [Armatimonadota bacterium]
MRQGNCSWVRKQKWRYLDKTLPASLQQRVEAHLAVCIPCRAEFAQAQEAMDALIAGKSLTPEQRRALQRSRTRLSLSKIAAIGIAALLVGAGIYLWRVQGDVLLARLNQRGVESTTLTTPTLTASPTAAEPSTPLVVIPPSEATMSPVAEPRALETPPKPAGTEARAKSPTTNSRPRLSSPPKRSNATFMKPKSTPQPAEGVVEVYDEAGNLIKRERIGGKE